MNGLLVTSVLLCCGSWWLFGFSFATVLCTISTLMFCGRKIGYWCNPNKIYALEGVGVFITIMFRLLLHKFVLWRVVLYVLCRLVFLFIMYYDNTEFVYIHEEITVEGKEEE